MQKPFDFLIMKKSLFVCTSLKSMCTITIPLILLIDNSLDFAYLIDRYGAKSGCRIDHATTIEGALAKIKHNPPEALLLNLMLPSNSGWQLLQSAKCDESLKRIPIIGFSSIRDEARARVEGADYYLWKPIMYDDFLSALEAVGVKRPVAPDR
jgi:CheY-like chemotaxis protein